MTGDARARPARRTAEPEPEPPARPESPELDTVVEEPWCAEVALDRLDSPVTPTSRYFVRSHFPVPTVGVRNWSVALEGEVERPRRLSMAELRSLPMREIVATMECAGNSRSSISPRTKGVRWQNGAVGTARWRGVSLAEVLESAGVKPGAFEVVLEGADRGEETGVAGEIPYEMSIPIPKALEPDTLLALEMNGSPLSRAHGAPVRAIVPGWYGMASVKWLTRVRVVDRPFRGFFRAESYVVVREGDDPEASKVPVKELLIKSLITHPADHAELPVGRCELKGFAWSGGGPVGKVEVSGAPFATLEEGLAWAPATLQPAVGRWAWQAWSASLDFERPGYYLLRARATGEDGAAQPLHPSWNYRGVATNAVHAVTVVVRSRRAPAADPVPPAPNRSG